MPPPPAQALTERRLPNFIRSGPDGTFIKPRVTASAPTRNTSIGADYDG